MLTDGKNKRIFKIYFKTLGFPLGSKKAAQLNDKIKNRQLLKTKRKSETNIQKRNTNEAKSFDEEQFAKQVCCVFLSEICNKYNTLIIMRKYVNVNICQLNKVIDTLLLINLVRN